MFEALLHLEDRLVQEGLQNGRLNAHQVAFDDGRQLGLAKGAEMGHELGFYFGHLLLWRCLHPPPPPPPSAVVVVVVEGAGDEVQRPLPPIGCQEEEQPRPHHHHHQKQKQHVHRRAVEALGKLQELVCSFPRDPTREDLFELLDRIRGKYRQTASLLKAPPAWARYPGYPTAAAATSSSATPLPSADDGQPAASPSSSSASSSSSSNTRLAF